MTNRGGGHAGQAGAQVYLAVDLGASSGRVMAGRAEGRHVEISEVHRFDNGPVPIADRMYWDILRLWSEIQTGLGLAVERFGDSIVSIGVDTWGVDFSLVGGGDELLGNPRHYRDPRTRGGLARAFAKVPREEIFEATGVQFMELNTLYQLLAIRDEAPELLQSARRFLMIPDLLHWYLTGVMSNEYTNATTTQIFDPRSGQWARSLLDRFDIPTHLFGEVTAPGTDLGPIRPAVAQHTGLARSVRVLLPGTHDTASAVMAVPTTAVARSAPDWCYISSGTWSLMGVELAQPIISRRCSELNFTNEGGVGGTVRLLKNIAGLWLVQECRRTWARRGRAFDWSELTRLAEQAPPRVCVIDPDDPSLAAPSDMPAAIQALCRASGQPEPTDDGAIVRCALESLALRYRMVLMSLEELVGHRLHTIHIVGGGTRNRLLCQMVADACGRSVLAGPVEATAWGNVAMQMVAFGAVESISESRSLIRQSQPLDEYVPRDVGPWDELWERRKGILQAG